MTYTIIERVLRLRWFRALLIDVYLDTVAATVLIGEQRGTAVAIAPPLVGNSTLHYVTA